MTASTPLTHMRHLELLVVAQAETSSRRSDADIQLATLSREQLITRILNHRDKLTAAKHRRRRPPKPPQATLGSLAA